MTARAALPRAFFLCAAVAPFVLGGCAREADREAPAPPAPAPTPTPAPVPAPASACPPDELLGALHAAAFHLEHGTPAEARADLRAAGAIPAGDATSLELLGALRGAVDRAEGDPAGARLVSEEVRARLADWACLGPELHRALHERLPPLEVP